MASTTTATTTVNVIPLTFTTQNLMSENNCDIKQQTILIRTCTPSSNGKSNSAKKSVKRLKSESGNSTAELLRCKRRIDFTTLGYSLPKAQPAAVARRNERERNRVKQVNMGFTTLREHVPNAAKNKKMSKVDTLRSATEYIKYLQQLLEENDAVDAALGSTGGVVSVASSHIRSVLSPSCSIDASPSPSACSTGDSSCEDALSPDEEDLLDFTSWFMS